MRHQGTAIHIEWADVAGRERESFFPIPFERVGRVKGSGQFVQRRHGVTPAGSSPQNGDGLYTTCISMVQPEESLSV